MIRIFDAAVCTRAEMLFRDTGAEASAEAAVDAILQDVRENGDRALLAYAKKFDRAELTQVEVSAAEIDAAMAALPEELLETIRRSAEHIRAFHSRQVRTGFSIDDRPGVVLGQRILPLMRVGIYVPGGRASYPSTVLMNAIPAKLAGVPEILMTTPPQADGTVAPAILAAARIAGVNRIFKTGGAQAVAALAYGTETIPRVDKIVGPGNVFVATAKRKVFGQVSIDMIAGPSEILVVADEKTNPVYAAADLLSQAEHDPMAAPILVTDSMALAKKVQQELERQIPLLPKAEICRTSVDSNGKIIVAATLAEAVDIANDIAPEHLELCVDDPFALLGLVKNAGSIFLGRNAPEALGDYFAGPNHTLPTSGTARFSSPLSVDDFIKKSSFIYYTREALQAECGDIVRFAEQEGLRAHARSVSVRFEEEQQ